MLYNFIKKITLRDSSRGKKSVFIRQNLCYLCAKRLLRHALIFVLDINYVRIFCISLNIHYLCTF